MKTKLRSLLQACLILTGGFYLGGCASAELKEYKGKPFQDSVYHGGPQKIPGRVQCAYYDFGGEGVAYHNTDTKNHGSGELNPAERDVSQRVSNERGRQYVLHEIPRRD